MAQAVQIGQVLVDKYRVERILGEGGMAVVLAARHIHLGHPVAIKIMLPKATELFPDATVRFLREGQALVRLTGDHVARVMDVGMLGANTPYLVMEYLEGADLGEVLARTGPLAIEDAVDYTIQACVAMTEAHAAGIVHRDLKPGNLFLTMRPNGKPLIKVLDFGISKVMELSEHHKPTVTQTWGSMGSPPYMSPEQSKSAKYVDARSDVWALGAILHQLLCGRLPFPGEAAPEIFANIMYMPPAPLREAAPWVPEALEDVLLRALVKDPAQRIQSMPELAAALAPFASAHGRSIAEAAFNVEDITEFTPMQHDHEDELSLPSVIVKGPTSRHNTPLPPEVARVLEARALEDRPPRPILLLPARRRSRGRWLIAVIAFLFVVGLGAGAVLFDWWGSLEALIPGASEPGMAPARDTGAPAGDTAEPAGAAGERGAAARGAGADRAAPAAPAEPGADGPEPGADGPKPGADAADGPDAAGEDSADAAQPGDGEAASPADGDSRPQRKRRRPRRRSGDDDPFGTIGEPIR